MFKPFFLIERDWALSGYCNELKGCLRCLGCLRITMPLQRPYPLLWERGPPVVLSEDLFDGQAPFRRINSPWTVHRRTSLESWVAHTTLHQASKFHVGPR